jgi:hypothetical protein
MAPNNPNTPPAAFINERLVITLLLCPTQVAIRYQPNLFFVIYENGLQFSGLYQPLKDLVRPVFTKVML